MQASLHVIALLTYTRIHPNAKKSNLTPAVFASSSSVCLGDSKKELSRSLLLFFPSLVRRVGGVWGRYVCQGGGGGVEWSRQIQVFIERSYGMTEESHYLLIKYWSWAVQVLTSKLIWADPWDQWLEVCVRVCAHNWMKKIESNRERERERERKKEDGLKVWQAERAGEREREIVYKCKY